jgi:predicted metalloprotease with PDZ domain
MTILYRRIAVLALLVSATMTFAQKRQPQPAASTAPAQPIKLMVDATHAPDKILRAQLQIPVAAGEVKLVFPKWIPGEHGPTGPITDLTGLQFFANGQRLSWRRDLDEMFTFHVTVPQGVTILEARLDLVMPAPPEGFSSGASATTQLDMLSWNQVVLYVPGRHTDDIPVVASLKLPSGWHFGTALPVASEAGGQINFQQVSLTTLVDSPVLAGAHFRRIPLTPEGPIQHYIDEVADGDAALQMPADTIAQYKRLMAETGALYGARHYREYHFLLTLSDHTAHFGLEHHESSDDRVPERTMIDDDARWLSASLLSHEMTHSWNGKFRRPAGLATPDYRQPMDGSMLWAYEGLTNYLGWLLGARAGLMTPEQSRDHLASIAAMLDNRGGKAWRPVEDTGTAAQILYGSPDAWQSQRRSVDFYDEGTLIWLEADTIIRQATGGKKSLDDFCKLFLGGTDSSPMLQPYVADDVYSALNRVAEHDWKQFFTERVQQIHPRAPLGGVEASGWRLGWSEEKGPRVRAREDADAYEITDELFSLGFDAHKDGALIDVLTDSPAARAGLAPGMKLVAVDGRRYSRKVLEDALRLGKGSGQPVALLAENGEFFRTFDLDWSAGLRFPKLERDSAKPDLLEEIMRPHAK